MSLLQSNVRKASLLKRNRRSSALVQFVKARTAFTSRIFPKTMFWSLSRVNTAPVAGKRPATIRWITLVVMSVLTLTGGIYYEINTARGQAFLFHWVTTKFAYQVEPGKNSELPFPKTGPLDERRGHVRLPDMVATLEKQGYAVQAQARLSPELLELAEHDIPLIYPEKVQAGLRMLDRDGQLLYQVKSPNRIFSSYSAIPPIIVYTLLFIENRELLDPCCPYKNPALEWDRFAYAVLQKGLQNIDTSRHVPGGSTLATQIEKFRHSPEGRTSNSEEKLRQILSASLRSYLPGETTLGTRKLIIRDYLNTFPIGALPGIGEIEGLGDGLWAWYGTDVHAVTPLLRDLERQVADHDGRGAAAYKQVLSLLLALRRPAYYMKNELALNQLADSYLAALADAGVISTKLRNAAIQYPLTFHWSSKTPTHPSFVQRKAQNMIRVQLQHLLGIKQLYELDRLDLTAKTTIDHRLQSRATTLLTQLKDPGFVKAAQLNGHHLLDRGNPGGVVFSLSLYERTPEGNLLRVQTDTLDKPLDVNRGTKMDLGSTAKLRTLIHYLQVIEQLHAMYAPRSNKELQDIKTEKLGRLARWAVEYLEEASDRSLAPMLNAALNRQYSANPSERFLTGGGLHTFSNFNHLDDHKVMPVREAFRNSVNLVFIRMMRDIVEYAVAQSPGATALQAKELEVSARKAYLVKFAKQEGRTFLRGFYNTYSRKTPDEAFEALLQGSQVTPLRLAVMIRTVYPEKDFAAFSQLMREHYSPTSLSESAMTRLFDKIAPDKLGLHDRGYLARKHPLELWTVSYLRVHPQATFTEVVQASDDVVVNVYAWLFRSDQKSAQDLRIRFILEQEAFIEIHKAWKRLGYPFDSLVPSYATSIGSSADRPDGLAQLMGILVNDGVKLPMISIRHLRFAEGTPYETHVAPQKPTFEQVLNPEIAWLVRDELVGVVEEGTAKRAFESIVDEDGNPVLIAGKTGTGDHRYKVFRHGLRLVESRAVSRTATFVFMIGDRHFGTITAQVRGPESANYTFTSSLPVAVFRLLGPEFSNALYGHRPTEVVGVQKPASPIDVRVKVQQRSPAA